MSDRDEIARLLPPFAALFLLAACGLAVGAVARLGPPWHPMTKEYILHRCPGFPFRMWREWLEADPPRMVPYTQEWADKMMPPPKWSPDFEGVKREAISAAPPPGEHPRVFISEEDLPEIRARIRTSRWAGCYWRLLCAETGNFMVKGKESPRPKVRVIKDQPAIEAGAGLETDDVAAELEGTPEAVPEPRP